MLSLNYGRRACEPSVPARDNDRSAYDQIVGREGKEPGGGGECRDIKSATFEQ